MSDEHALAKRDRERTVKARRARELENRQATGCEPSRQPRRAPGLRGRRPLLGITVFVVAAVAGLLAIGLWFVDRRRHRGSRRW